MSSRWASTVRTERPMVRYAPVLSALQPSAAAGVEACKRPWCNGRLPQAATPFGTLFAPVDGG